VGELCRRAIEDDTRKAEIWLDIEQQGPVIDWEVMYCPMCGKINQILRDHGYAVSPPALCFECQRRRGD
jgi:hypothetical protein